MEQPEVQAPTFLGVPMKHVSLVTVGSSATPRGGHVYVALDLLLTLMLPETAMFPELGTDSCKSYRRI